MSGFTNLIYFNNEPNEGLIIQLVKSRGNVIEFVNEEEGFLIDILVKNPTDNKNHSFRIYSSTKDDFNNENLLEYERKMGFIPPYYIGLMSWDNEKFGELFIANLMIDILNMYPGLVDLLGIINPKNKSDLRGIREYVKGVKGRIIELENKEIKDVLNFTHVLDKEFLSNWTSTSEFYIPN